MSNEKLLLIFFCLFLTKAFGQEISYKVDLSEAHKNTYNVELHLRYEEAPDSIVLKMATWTPGSYLIREFSKHVNLYEAKDKDSNTLGSFKINKNTWLIRNQAEKEVVFAYSVYAHELSVRTSYLNSDFALINGTSIFIYPENALDKNSEIEFILPENWRVSTTLEQAKSNPAKFSATNYDLLFDSPFFLGTHNEFSFEAEGVNHRFAINGPGFYDEEKLKEDISKIISVQTKIFGENPNEEYLFIVISHERGGGGLEHSNSSTMIVDRFNLAEQSSYRRFLGLVAHEYFHLWNVKRIRPIELGPFDYENENYTDLLWVMEGFTTYYGGKTLLRIDLSQDESFLRRIANSLEREYAKPGGKVQSLAESSLDAWIKLYRDDENDYNATVSYYGRGFLMAALVDMIIVKNSNGEKSLDDLMKNLYDKYYKSENRGFTINELQKEIEILGKVDMTGFFNNHIKGTDFPEIDTIMPNFGYEVEFVQKEEDSWGISLKTEDEHYLIRRVVDASVAREGGLNVGDEIIAVNNFQYENNLLARLRSIYPSGSKVQFTVLRNGLLKNIMVQIPGRMVKVPEISLSQEPNERALELREKLLYN